MNKRLVRCIDAKGVKSVKEGEIYEAFGEPSRTGKLDIIVGKKKNGMPKWSRVGHERFEEVK